MNPNLNFRHFERYSGCWGSYNDDGRPNIECEWYEACINTGSAYVFTSDDDNKWTEQSKLLEPDRDWRDNFGKSVAIDKDTVVVGSSWDDWGPLLGVQTWERHMSLLEMVTHGNIKLVWEIHILIEISSLALVLMFLETQSLLANLMRHGVKPGL